MPRHSDVADLTLQTREGWKGRSVRELWVQSCSQHPGRI